MGNESEMSLESPLRTYAYPIDTFRFAIKFAETAAVPAMVGTVFALSTGNDTNPKKANTALTTDGYH